MEPLLRLDGSVHAELAHGNPQCVGRVVTSRPLLETRPQVERLMCRTWLRDGEGLAQKLMGRVPNYTFATSVPFALELLEPDYLPFSYNNLSKGIVQGIERYTWRRKRAHYLLKDHPGQPADAGR
ncbi:phage portal protein [Pseudomonas aeruginosa]